MEGLEGRFDEMPAAKEFDAQLDVDKVDMSDATDEELAADAGKVGSIDDFEVNESASVSRCEDEWGEEDLKVYYETMDEPRGDLADTDGLTENAGDINENVPLEWGNIEGEHGIEADAERVNPNYNPERNGEWENNCQSCAPTYEMRRRGYDVEAKPFSDENEYLSLTPEDAWDNPDIQTTEGNGKADIEHQMQEWGDGARAEVIVYWKTGGGHAFCAEQVDGETRFVDPQVASSYATYDAGVYFDQVRNDGSTYYWRIDDVKPSSNIGDCCKEATR